MIKKIIIENFKSIERVQFDFDKPTQEIICLIGKNGAGKSNIFKALRYFFDHINKPYSDQIIIDNSNPYIQCCTISVTFDLSKLYIKSKQNQKLYTRFHEIKEYKDKVFGQKLDYHSLIGEDFLIELKLSQYRNGTIVWNINNESICKTLKSAFPFYYFDTRTLDLFTWDKLWQIISDLTSTVSEKSQTECAELLDNTLKSIYGEKYIKSAKILEDVFSHNNIAFDSFRFDSRFKSALSVRFGGEKFTVNKRSLDYYSDGTNSYYYLLLLSTLIPKISDISCKYPIVIIDEPETGLHSEYITRFVKSVFEHVKNNAFMMFSTHSPLLICDLTNIKANYCLYKVAQKRQHSVINKMNIAWLSDSTHRITVKETECYFAEYLVYVEGETEIQLFHNPHLLSLFPWLEKIHFYSFDSNHQRLKAVNSKELNLGTDYRMLVDIDKIIKYNPTRQKFISYNVDINPLNKKNIEYYDYYKKRETDRDTLTKNIKALMNRTYQSNGSFYIGDNDFISLITDIQTFCEMYSIIVNRTTIEGEIITHENTSEFLKFLSTEYFINNPIIKDKQQQHSDILSVSDSYKKTCLIRCEFEGRIDAYVDNDSLTFNGKGIQRIVDKTSGWINDWLNYYFTNNIDTVEDDNIKISIFKRDFPSLFNTLQSFEKMIDYTCE